MIDLQDGESITIEGSSGRPYHLKNVAGVYSCSCPAWRNQSLPIDRRTCKHLRTVRGDAAEGARLGGILPQVAQPHAPAKAPPLLLAETWNGETDPSGWLLSEKLDGVRAYWDGKQFLSRGGNRYFAPDWFTEGLPLEPLDGELWIGRKQFQRTVSIVRRQDAGELWREVRFVMFDAPANDTDFEYRLEIVRLVVQLHSPRFAIAHPHVACTGRRHVEEELNRIEALGGEGLMLRRPGALYEAGRSSSLLKVKRFKDAEARVIGHEPGSGRHKGRLGALLVETVDGVRFSVGTGLSDAERSRPPAIGSVISFRYQELSDTGVPRFPSYVRAHPAEVSSDSETTKGTSMAVFKRRFEFTEGNSYKFWAISVTRTEVLVTFGRIGTSGQSEKKTFGDAPAALKHADKKISEKLKKGYQEVS